MLHHSPVLNATLAGRAPSSHVLAKETLTFQSAYPRGTQYPTQFRDTTWNGCFNPRARVGRDAEYLINAGTNGSFNPRARVGRDASHCRPPSRKPWFQSTRPRGARPVPCALSRSAWRSFNPRARVGRDEYRSLFPHVELTFQSTRPRGARRFTLFNLTLQDEVSIHAPAWGATRPFLQACRPR